LMRGASVEKNKKKNSKNKSKSANMLLYNVL
jgi:hypothetical protein